VRNLLKFLNDYVGLWVVRVDGMIHPSAARDPILAPLHRSFLISSILSGVAALIVLPLHLALAGPPHAAVLLVLTWMMSQWPLALYLSRSGALNRTIGLSSGLFACLVAGICLLTGGLRSFALPWLLAPLMETAFATNRKTPLLVTLMCAGLLAGLALLPLPGMQIAVPEGNIPFYTALSALIYAGVLSFRLTLDRLLARRAVDRSEARLSMIAQGSSDVVCDLAPNGAIRVLGGSVSKLVGAFPLDEGEDWLFPRLHVADRPLYLTSLSDARHGGEVKSFDVRVRVGRSRPGEAGMPEYRHLVLTMQQTRPGAGPAADLEARLILTLSAGAAVPPEQASAPSQAVPAQDVVRPDVVTPRERVEPPMSNDRLIRSDGLASEGQTVSNTGRQFEKASSRNPAPETGPGASAVDISACLEQCRDLLVPVAARRGVMLDLVAGSDLPMVAVNAKSVRQALYFLLADMIETCGEGALLTVSADREAEGLDCVLAVRNRPSGLPWCADGSELVFDSASSLLAETGGHLSVRAVPGQGDCVVVHLPLCPRSEAAKPLAKTA